MAVFAELFSAKGVGVLYRATTGTMTVDWKPVHAFPSKEAAEAQTKLEAAEFHRAFYRVAIHEMGIHPDMVWVPPGEFQLGSPDEESERYADEDRSSSRSSRLVFGCTSTTSLRQNTST